MLAGAIGLPASAQAKVHLKISVNGIAADSFENWTAGGSWEKIDNFKNRNAGRPVVDLLLQLRALKAGGLDFDFELVPTLTYDLAKKAVIDGHVHLTAESIWDNEIEESAGALLKSDPIIRDGEFLKGVYVHASNEKLRTLSSIDELRACTGAVVSSWALDVKTVESMKLKELVKAPTLELVFAAIQKQKADFMLMEFSSNADMSAEVGGIKLLPVPNCKVAITGSRSWIVSKNLPDAAAIHKALVAGTKILRENGTIERAYKECGFFNAKVADWKRLF
jgi:hypothetical protein